MRERVALAAIELKRRAELEQSGIEPGSEDQDDFAARTERLEKSLSLYTKAAWPVLEPETEYLHNWHIDLISEYLEAITRGELTRVVFNMPPRYMKSILISVMWPTWEWASMPYTRWIFASHAATLSTKHSVDRRALIRSEWYQKRWGLRFHMTGDQDVKTEFMNDRRGVMVATSVGGTALGKGGNRIVVDDPHDPQQAESKVERQKAIDFFDRTLTRRLDDKKKGAIVVVMQRLHQQDLTARVVELGYIHVKIPAEAPTKTTVIFRSGRKVEREAGDLLWPEREGPKEIQDAKDTLGSYAYAGQYLQEPVPPGGGIFPTDRLIFIKPHEVPREIRAVRGWDKAASETARADRSAGVKIGIDKEKRIYVLHAEFGRWSTYKRETTIRNTALMDGTRVRVQVEMEGGASGKSDAENTLKNLAGFDAHAARATGDKIVRARPFAAAVEANNVHVVLGEWNREYVDELSIFPNGQHDDLVDASSIAYNQLTLGYARSTYADDPFAGAEGLE